MTKKRSEEKKSIQGDYLIYGKTSEDEVEERDDSWITISSFLKVALFLAACAAGLFVVLSKTQNPKALSVFCVFIPGAVYLCIYPCLNFCFRVRDDDEEKSS